MLVLSPRAGRHNIAEALQFRRLLLEGVTRGSIVVCARRPFEHFKTVVHTQGRHESVRRGRSLWIGADGRTAVLCKASKIRGEGSRRIGEGVKGLTRSETDKSGCQ